MKGGPWWHNERYMITHSPLSPSPNSPRAPPLRLSVRSFTRFFARLSIPTLFCTLLGPSLAWLCRLMRQPLLLLLLLLCPALRTVKGVGVEEVVVRPETFGAVGDGRHNDTAAVWRAVGACAAAEEVSCAVLFSFNKTYLMGPLLVTAPMELRIRGTVMALPRAQYPIKSLPAFITVQNFASSAFYITGMEATPVSPAIRAVPRGSIDFQGSDWWPCKHTGCWRPHGMVFSNLTGGLVVRDLDLFNSPNHFMEVSDCHGVRVTGCNLQAPNDSPNTDGINFYGGSDQLFARSTVHNGDDCVSVVCSGPSDRCVLAPQLCQGGSVVVEDVLCSGGHGASIGSVHHGVVQNVTFRNLTLTRGPNSTQGLYSGGGCRIKTYPNGTGSISDINYEGIAVQGVVFPIQILGRYCPPSQTPWPCPEGRQAVVISNITFRNIQGFGHDFLVGQFACGDIVPCQGILLENVLLGGKADEPLAASRQSSSQSNSSAGKPEASGLPARFECKNAFGTAVNTTPASCLVPLPYLLGLT